MRILLICSLLLACEAGTVPLALVGTDATLQPDAAPQADAGADAAADAAKSSDGSADAGDGATTGDATADDGGEQDGVSPDLGSADGGPDAEVEDIDQQDPSCMDADYAPGACVAGTGARHEAISSGHVDLPEVIEYERQPPSSGDHRPQWARWGEYTYLPPQRWLHNLEHGGIALLYNPCAGEAVVDALREIALTRPDDAEGEFRWLLTPYVGLETAVAVVAWEWTYTAECVGADEINDFINLHYRMAPEDARGDGAYDTNYVER